MAGVPDILAIVSKAIFERDARLDGRMLAAGDVWPVDRYNSSSKALQSLADGGRIFLVTVRPPNEQLWLVAVVAEPKFDGSAWIGRPNKTAATNITGLRKSIQFESGKGMTQDKGTLGMSLQTPRALTAGDVTQILDAVKAPAHARDSHPVHAAPKSAVKPRTIGGKYELVRAARQGRHGHRLRGAPRRDGPARRGQGDPQR